MPVRKEQTRKDKCAEARGAWGTGRNTASLALGAGAGAACEMRSVGPLRDGERA